MSVISPGFDHARERRFQAHEQHVADPVHALVHVAAALTDEADHELYRVDDAERIGAEGARRDANVELRIAHRADLIAEGLIENVTDGDEVQLADEVVAARELVDQPADERVIAGLQRVRRALRAERGDVTAVLEEQRDLVRVDRQLSPKREILVRVLVDDLLLLGIRARDHHPLHAAFDEIHDAHARLLTRCTRSAATLADCSLTFTNSVAAAGAGNRARRAAPARGATLCDPSLAAMHSDIELETLPVPVQRVLGQGGARPGQADGRARRDPGRQAGRHRDRRLACWPAARIRSLPKSRAPR